MYTGAQTYLIFTGIQLHLTYRNTDILKILMHTTTASDVNEIPAPVQTSPGVNPASYTKGTGSFPGVKRPGRGVDHPI